MSDIQCAALVRILTYIWLRKPFGLAIAGLVQVHQRLPLHSISDQVARDSFLSVVGN